MRFLRLGRTEEPPDPRHLGFLGLALLPILSALGASIDLPQLSLERILGLGVLGGPLCGFVAADEPRIAGVFGGLVAGLSVALAPVALLGATALLTPASVDLARLLVVPFTFTALAPGWVTYAAVRRSLEA